jgi:hypothetical protein
MTYATHYGPRTPIMSPTRAAQRQRGVIPAPLKHVIVSGVDRDGKAFRDVYKSFPLGIDYAIALADAERMVANVNRDQARGTYWTVHTETY